MKSNLAKRLVTSALIAAFWIIVWYIAAFLVDSILLLPTPHDTLLALLDLICTLEFYKVVLATLLRVALSLFFGISTGVILALLSFRFPILKKVLYPAISAIRAMPVASFIVLLWVLLDGDALTVLVAFLMVMPIIWQNTLDGFSSIPIELIEVADVFEFSFKRRFKVLILPVISSYIFPAIITSVGLAWKSEIAAEIIAYTENSIGMHVNDAKFYPEMTPIVFAWTAVIIAMSVLLEIVIRKLLRRFKNEP